MPQKQKLSLEEKVEIIRDYLEGTISKSEAARRGGVARDTIQQWARNYESDGEDAFLLHKNRVYSPELKRQAVEDYLSGVGSQSEICKKYHIRKRMQLQKWIKVYNAHGDFNSAKFWHCKVNMKKLGPEISQYRYATSRNSRLRFLDSLSPAHCAGVRLFKAE